jgi:hypothetical protein
MELTIVLPPTGFFHRPNFAIASGKTDGCPFLKTETKTKSATFVKIYAKV